MGRRLLHQVGDTTFEVSDAFDNALYDGPGSPPPTVPPKPPQVTKVLQSVSGDMTRQELMSALRLKNRRHFGTLYLQPALDGGLLEMTIPGKPRSSKQRYRLTERGRAILVGSRLCIGGWCRHVQHAVPCQVIDRQDA